MTASKRDYYINPIANGSMSWRSVQSRDEYSEVVFDNWKQVMKNYPCIAVFFMQSNGSGQRLGNFQLMMRIRIYIVSLWIWSMQLWRSIIF
jgi:hypothetical protein